jgi:MYXO-CTERM domain-containing protein
MGKLLASGLALVGLVGCITDQPETSSTAGRTFEELKASIYREPGTDTYVLDFDTVIRGDEALFAYFSQFQQGALAIYATGGADVKWDATAKKNLTYCIGAGFGANKPLVVAAMAAASDAGWEKFADVNYIYVPAQDANCTAANANVMFDVNQVNANGQYLARSFFPNDTRANRNVLIDPNAFIPAQTGNIPLANILGHELGHTLGFRHEHIRADQGRAVQCPEDNEYRGVTAYDVVSVMHYPQCGSPGNLLTFSPSDRTGVALIYGAPVVNMAPMAQVSAPTDGAIVPPSFTVEGAVIDTDLVKAELLVDGTTYQTITTAPFQFTVTNLALGSHTLEIKGTDSAGLTGSQTINVTVSNSGGGAGGGSGGGDGGGGDGSNDVTGGCNAGGSSTWLFGLGLVGAALLRRKRS